MKKVPRSFTPVRTVRSPDPSSMKSTPRIPRFQRFLAAGLALLFALQPVALAGPPCSWRALVGSRKCCCVAREDPIASTCCAQREAARRTQGPSGIDPQKRCGCGVQAPAFPRSSDPRREGGSGLQRIRDHLARAARESSRTPCLPLAPPPPSLDPFASDGRRPRAPDSPPVLMERGVKGLLAVLCIARL